LATLTHVGKESDSGEEVELKKGLAEGNQELDLGEGETESEIDCSCGALGCADGLLER
ncbi:Hypothetical predicted protein, partial [Olea europaea subsp. europaea]